MNRIGISERYDYINEDSINERLKCPICSNPFINPVKTKCQPKGHTFCYQCIKDWLQRNSSCPSCRQNIKTEDLIPITEGILLDMLNELPVQCLVCKKTGLERGNFDEHINKQCMKEKILCSSADLKCPWTGSHKQLEEHLKTCPYTKLRPVLLQIMTEKQQLKQQINQHKTLIDKLQQENQQLKEELVQQKRPMPKPPSGRLPSHPQKLTLQNTAQPSVSNNKQSSSSKASCDNCSDCWRGAVRGSYFRGQGGGGFKAGTTLLLCDCDCHK